MQEIEQHIKWNCSNSSLCFVLLFILLLTNCENKSTGSSWAAMLPGLGTNASPRLVDLNQDGILDIVMGAGKNEFQKSDSAVVALNGKNGRLLWTTPASDQIAGSPIFLDINGDQISDVFIGGRGANFMAINGKDGQIIWQFQRPDSTDSPLRNARYNFYTPQFVKDQDGDGLQDILVAHGGNVKAPMGNSFLRFPGLLFVFSSKNGKILSYAEMPDGKETYLSPVIVKQANEWRIYFGSGGETIGGLFYQTTLSDLMKGDISKAKILARGKDHGFIAPPTLVDITKDGTLDILTSNHDGTIYAINGKDHQIIWQLKIPNTECNTNLAIGYFNEDDIPDCFAHLSKGVWPENIGTYQLMIDGKDGSILKQESKGCTGFYSPICFDFDNDEREEVLLSFNDYTCGALNLIRSNHAFLLFDYQKESSEIFIQPEKAKNISSTPWIGDMDKDGLLDIVYCLQANHHQIYSFHDIAVMRYKTRIPIKKSPTWGAYMGNQYNSIFQPSNH